MKHKSGIINKILKGFIWVVLGIVSIAALLITVGSLIFYYYTEYAPYRGKQYDRAVWFSVEAPSSDKDVRCGMTTDILDNHLHKGMKKEEVEGLLGKISSYFYCLDQKIKFTTYYMGTCDFSDQRGKSIEVCFDEKEEVVHFGKYEDKEEAVHCGKNDLPCDVYHRALCFLDSSESCLCTIKGEYGNQTVQKCKIEKW